MAALRALMVVTATAALAQIAMGVSFMVGGASSGWDLRTDLRTWASSQSFTVGDSLIFTYSALHSVLEVSKADYDACQTDSPIQSFADGNTVINLSSPGKRYFICGTPGHCSQGMNVEINIVSAAAVTAPTTPPVSPPPPSPSTPPAKSPPPVTASAPPLSSPPATKSPPPAPHTSHSEAPRVPPSVAPSSLPSLRNSPSSAPIIAPSVSPPVDPTASEAAPPPPASAAAHVCILQMRVVVGLMVGLLFFWPS